MWSEVDYHPGKGIPTCLTCLVNQSCYSALSGNQGNRVSTPSIALTQTRSLYLHTRAFSCALIPSLLGGRAQPGRRSDALRISANERKKAGPVQRGGPCAASPSDSASKSTKSLVSNEFERINMFWGLFLNVCFISHCKFASSHIKEGLIMEQDPESRDSIKNFTTDYKIIRTLGRGRFSVVKMAYHVPTLTCVAIKVLKNTKKCSSVMSREVDILKSLGHPHIIKVVEVVQTREATHLVMEHASQGDLLDRIRECGYLKSWEARRMFRQILEAVQFCHDNNIVHRDIKANNILIDGRWNAKLCDFGLAAKTLPGQKLIDFCGTLPYCAPEFFEAEEYEGRPFDVWSVGVLLFFMVTGHLPFLGKSFAEVRRQISSANFSIPPHVANDIFNVIVEMLMINPSRRPSIQQIMMRPMIKDSQAYSPPTSIQTFTGTPSPSTIKAMRVMRHTPEKSTESLIDPNINEVLATYLIQQHKPLRKVCTHHQVEPENMVFIMK
ncbi:sperm motility kinase X-like [Rattus norvegicus]|uniref:sperm motility kinase X-like n=1 Tax=Rattus norvegicus TaxID=10116 RepID=UPI002FD8515C